MPHAHLEGSRERERPERTFVNRLSDPTRQLCLVSPKFWNEKRQPLPRLRVTLLVRS